VNGSPLTPDVVVFASTAPGDGARRLRNFNKLLRLEYLERLGELEREDEQRIPIGDGREHFAPVEDET
jgi:hypothetical protein